MPCLYVHMHNKIVQRLLTQNNNLKLAQIVLSALTTGGFLTSIITHEKVISIIGALISIALLILKRRTDFFWTRDRRHASYSIRRIQREVQEAVLGGFLGIIVERVSIIIGK